MPQLDSLINFNHAFMSYKDFLFSENNTLLSNTKNIKMLEVLFSCLNIIMNKDRIKTKDEDPSNYIDENILEQIILIREDVYRHKSLILLVLLTHIIKRVAHQVKHIAAILLPAELTEYSHLVTHLVSRLKSEREIICKLVQLDGPHHKVSCQ